MIYFSLIQFLILIVFSLFIATTILYVMYYYPHFLRGIRKFDRQISLIEFEELIRSNHLPNFIIQITTKGGEMATISQGLKNIDEVVSHLPTKISSKIQVDILTEQEDDKNAVNNLILNIKPNVIVVPENYQTTNGTRLKARALQFMIDKRRSDLERIGYDLKDFYIIHFDSESTIDLGGMRTLIGTVLKYRTKEIFQGPIFYSNDWLKSGLFSRQMESLRPWNCYECYSLTSRGVPYHLHGSNIIVRCDTEAAIGWDFGTVKGYPVVAEDLFFGIKGYLTFGSKIFGWHGAYILEQPAFKLQDSIKQRVRWIRGSLQALEVVKNWKIYKTSSEKKKFAMLYRIRFKLIFYALGFIPSSITIASMIYVIIKNFDSILKNNSLDRGLETSSMSISVYIVPMIPYWIIIISMIGAVLWLMTIQIGLYHNLKLSGMTKLGRFKEHILILLISPFATLVDTGCAFFTLLTWSLGNKKAVWEITPKTA